MTTAPDYDKQLTLIVSVKEMKYTLGPEGLFIYSILLG